MSKILIIGQAPPAVKQIFPYDTTMLYDWLYECGITKEWAQELFEFEAMTNTFPGFDAHGGHKKPSLNEMSAHYDEFLRHKIGVAKKIILLGNVPKEFLRGTSIWHNNSIKILCLIHPSRRNYTLYMANKSKLIGNLKNFINS